MAEKETYTIDDVRKHFYVCRATVVNWIRWGWLEAIATGEGTHTRYVITAEALKKFEGGAFQERWSSNGGDNWKRRHGRM